MKLFIGAPVNTVHNTADSKPDPRSRSTNVPRDEDEAIEETVVLPPSKKTPPTATEEEKEVKRRANFETYEKNPQIL